MTQLHEHPQHDHPVVIREEGRTGSGIVLGLVLGIILAAVVVIGLVVMVFGVARDSSGNPTININPPNISIPDTITINPPAQQPGSTPPQDGNPPQDRDR